MQHIATLTPASLKQRIEQSKKPYVLINFYATFCKPCIKELPGLIALHKDTTSQVDVLFVALDDVTGQELSAFNEENGMDFATYRFTNADSATAFIRQYYPEWDNSVPLNIVYAAHPLRLVTQTGMTDRTEVEMILGQDQMMLP